MSSNCGLSLYGIAPMSSLAMSSWEVQIANCKQGCLPRIIVNEEWLLVLSCQQPQGAGRCPSPIFYGFCRVQGHVPIFVLLKQNGHNVFPGSCQKDPDYGHSRCGMQQHLPNIVHMWKSDPLSLLARSLIMFRSDRFIMAWNNRVSLLPFSLKSKTRMFLQDYNFWITSRDLQVDDDGLMEKIICVHGK